jgi:hypothetical protein
MLNQGILRGGKGLSKKKKNEKELVHQLHRYSTKLGTSPIKASFIYVSRMHRFLLILFYY